MYLKYFVEPFLKLRILSLYNITNFDRFYILLYFFPTCILARVLVGSYIAVTGVGWYLYLLNDKEIDRYQIESRSALVALTPLLEAESDRE